MWFVPACVVVAVRRDWLPNCVVMAIGCDWYSRISWCQLDVVGARVCGCGSWMYLMPRCVATAIGCHWYPRVWSTSNWHHEIREYQSHPIAMTTQLGNQSRRTATTTHAGTNHIQLAQPTSWVPISSNCHATHFGIKPHQTGTTKLVGTNHIQLLWPHTWASNTSNCHSHTRGHQVAVGCV